METVFPHCNRGEGRFDGMNEIPGCALQLSRSYREGQMFPIYRWRFRCRREDIGAAFRCGQPRGWRNRAADCSDVAV